MSILYVREVILRLDSNNFSLNDYMDYILVSCDVSSVSLMFAVLLIATIHSKYFTFKRHVPLTQFRGF